MAVKPIARNRSALRILLVLVAASVLAAGEAKAGILDQVLVAVQVRDGRWLDREATRFTSAYGGDLQKVRAEIAQVLYRSRSTAGIDFARPALVGWRGGRAPLIAALPVSNREAFLKDFGAVEPESPPLVRTGEREGTVVYRQNQPGGEVEYRLLVAGGTAFLARTAAECRALAAEYGTPGYDPALAPIEVSWRGAGLAELPFPAAHWIAALPDLPTAAPELAALRPLAASAWRDLAGQIATMSLAVGGDGHGELRLALRIAARRDAPLAAWIAAQRPGTERLAGQLRTPSTVLLASGRLVFQGQLERWAFDQIAAVQAACGPRWNETVDGAYRTLCTLIERSGALGLAVERHQAGTVQQWVAEHPRAVEVMQSASVLAAALGGGAAAQARVGQRDAITVTGATQASLYAAGDRHAVRVDDRGARRLAPSAADLLQRLDETGSLDDEAVLAAVWCDLSAAWNTPAGVDGEPAPGLPVRARLRQAGESAIEAAIALPLADLGRILARLHRPGARE